LVRYYGRKDYNFSWYSVQPNLTGVGPMNLPLTHGAPVGQIYVFRAVLQGAESHKLEVMEIPVAAYDFEQAMENLQRAYPQLEPYLDEMRIQKAIGEIHEPPTTT
jgi:hypothetical protein